MSYNMLAKTPSKPKPGTRRTMTNKNSPKLGEREYVYVSQPKADHHESDNRLTEFQWTGPYVAEKALLETKFLVRTNHKSIIARDYDHSRLDNPYPTCKPRHKNGEPTLR